MSGFPIIKAVTDQLIAGLSASFAADPLTAPFAAQIFSDSPASTGAGTGNKQGVSFWPYRISRDEFLYDPSLTPVGSTELAIPPLMVDIWYLVTPMTQHGDKNQLLIEKALQFVYDLGPLHVIGTDDADVTFETPGQDELFRLWSALNIPYQTSCVFVARHVAIDSTRKPLKAGRVIERFDRYVRIGS